MTRLTTISLGAGVQSTTLALLSADGTLPPVDYALFADTGWEPRAVYEHLDRLEAALPFPVLRVSNGSIRQRTTLGNRTLPVSLPLFVQNPDGGRGGIALRQCTEHYKMRPIRRRLRELLGAEPPDFLRVPAGNSAVQWVGFSTDEVGRANKGRDSGGVSYLSVEYPLLDLGWSRSDCQRYLRRHGWETVTKSACIGCPFHGNAAWRELRDNRPEEWADAVAFDEEIRAGDRAGLRGTPFLHRSLLPLAVAPIDRVTRREWDDAQLDVFDAVADVEEDGEPDGCSPYGCRSGEAVS